MSNQKEPMSKLVLLDALAANFNTKMPVELKKMWLMLLEPYPASIVSSAVVQVIEQYEYKTLPPFAVLKKALDDIAGIGAKSLEVQAVSEWGLLLENINTYGSYKKPVLHPTTDYAVRLLGGWGQACQWSLKELDFKRRDFIAMWKESNGRAEYMQLGADKILQNLMQGQSKKLLAVQGNNITRLKQITQPS